MGRHPIAIGLVLALLVAFLAPTTLLADFRESYRQGKSAVDKGKWAEADRLMGQAIAEQPTGGDKIKLYGMVFDFYIPHFYRGLALYSLGDCAGALRELEISERQGGAQKAGKLGELQRMKQDCLSKLPQPTQATATPSPTPTKAPTPGAMPTPTKVAAPGPTPTKVDTAVTEAIRKAELEIGQADAAAAAVDRQAAGSAAAAWRQEPALAASRDAATGTLGRARTKLASGRSTGKLADVEEAAALAAQARRQLETTSARLATLLNATPVPLPATPLAPTATAPPRSGITPPPATPTAGVTGPPIGSVTPPALVAATRAFVSGDYGQTLALLASPEFDSPRASALAHLLRAAAQYQEYRQGGQKDAGLREAAAADVRACKRLDGSVAPRQEHFSPGFLAFFTGTR